VRTELGQREFEADADGFEPEAGEAERELLRGPARTGQPPLMEPIGRLREAHLSREGDGRELFGALLSTLELFELTPPFGGEPRELTRSNTVLVAQLADSMGEGQR